MAEGYQIDIGAMKSLVSTLEHAKESMTSASGALKDASPRDLGGAGLDSAGKDFCETWEYGIGKIADLAGKMTGGLQDTLKTYQQAEREISKLFSGDGGEAASGAGSGTPTADTHISRALSGGES
ncbi:MAG: hypothetical protein ACRDQ5_22020 [Sciscionella sp.]